MHCGHADDQHGCVQRQRMQRGGSAFKRACDAVHGEPGEWELMHADVQQRVYYLRNEDLHFGDAHDQHCFVRPQPMRDLGARKRCLGQLYVEPSQRTIVHTRVQHTVVHPDGNRGVLLFARSPIRHNGVHGYTEVCRPPRSIGLVRTR